MSYAETLLFLGSDGVPGLVLRKAQHEVPIGPRQKGNTNLIRSLSKHVWNTSGARHMLFLFRQSSIRSITASAVEMSA